MERESEMALLARVRREWKATWGRRPLLDKKAVYEQHLALSGKHAFHVGEDADILAAMRASIEVEAARVVEAFKSQCPLGFFVPSWEQAQILNAWHPEYEPHLAPSGYRSVGVFAANRIGKFLRDEELVATLEGYVPIGSLKEGDCVLNGQGYPCRVLAVYPQGVRELYRVTFNDGTTVDSGGPHLWTVQTPGARFKEGMDYLTSPEVARLLKVSVGTVRRMCRDGRLTPVTMGSGVRGSRHRFRPSDFGVVLDDERWRTRTLDEIVEQFGAEPKPSMRCALPVSPAAQFLEVDLPIDPYFLGLLIGDGGLSGCSIRFSGIDDEIIKEVRVQADRFDCATKKYGKCDFALSARPGQRNKLKAALSALGLAGKTSHHKFIPAQYTTASFDQRAALLQGLMDTDGYCNPAGSALFYSVSKRLIDDVAEVARSLGCIVATGIKRGRYKGAEHLSYYVSFRHAPVELFRLSRKKERQSKKVDRWKPNKLFTKIEVAQPGLSTCITVDSPDGLFLLKNGTVTHNTTAGVIDTMLWLYPNDPDWKVFETYRDHKGREVRVFRRPDWDYWRRTGKMIYEVGVPPKSACEVWVGVVDDDHWENKIGKEFRLWTPKDAYGRHGKGEAWFKAEKKFVTRWGSTVQAKSFESDVMAWAGKAVWRIFFDEGPPEAIVREGMIRIQDGGNVIWTYTPAEARNIASRAKVAHAVYKGKLPLVGQLKCFVSFNMDDAPDHILPAEKKADDLRRFAQMGDEGKVRAGGGFFESSPTVFSMFDREQHILELSADEILERWPDANLVRGVDEGVAHPSACAWVALLRTGEMIVYRDWQASNTTVDSRCEAIIDLSRNVRVQDKGLREREDGGLDEVRRQWASQFSPQLRPTERLRAENVRWRERMVKETIRRTFMDYHVFRRDPTRPLDGGYANLYRRAGLAIEPSTNLGPNARCDYMNTLMRADATRKHLTEPSKPGCRLYVSRDCRTLIERFENFLFAQYKSGSQRGEFTGDVESLGDDLLDALAYAVCAQMRWTDPAVLDTRKARIMRWDNPALV